jgi:DNA modification methylase
MRQRRTSKSAPTTTSSQPTEFPLIVELWPLKRLRPYKRNPRRHDESSIAEIAASITEFGFKVPLLVTAKGKVIGGHGRLEAAKRLGLSELPVIVCGDLSALQAKALRLADNRIAEQSSWDFELLGAEIQALLDSDYEIDVLGFDSDEIAALLAEPTAGLTDPDEIPPLPSEPLTQPGDLWICGRHRLLCGDATKATDVRRLIGGRRAALMATDPPYLVDYDGGNHPQTWATNGRPISAEEKTRHWDDYTDHAHSVEFYRSYLEAALKYALAADPAVYQWFGAMRAPVVFEAWEAVGLLAHQTLIWVKSRPVLGRCHYMWNYEPLLYGWRKGSPPALKPPADARAVWEIDSKIEDGAAGIHPTMKPIECFRRPILYHTRPGGLIYEPFCGSGTALIAAEELGRSCYAIELAPGFCDVAVQRWSAFSGKEAHRHG